MNWTRERPTEPGLYWFKSDQEDIGVIPVAVEMSAGRLVVFEFGTEESWKLTVYDPGMWYGPLREPK